MDHEFDLKAQEEAFWNSPLDEEEQWDEDHSEGFVPCENQAEMRRQMMEAAARPAAVRHSGDATAEARKGRKPVTFRMDVADMDRIKQIAQEQGLQYQSLVGSVLHRYAAGTLVDIAEAKKILSS